jgi:hypothetical protein
MNKITKASFDYYINPEERKTLTIVLMGHLVIENLLVESIKTKMELPQEFDPYTLYFPSKVELCVSLKIIPIEKKNCYLKLNSIRNKFAHQLNYDLNYDDVFNYAKEMANAGFDFSDDTIHDDKEQAKEMYGVDLTLFEILEHLETDLICYLHDCGVQIPQ